MMIHVPDDLVSSVVKAIRQLTDRVEDNVQFGEDFTRHYAPEFLLSAEEISRVRAHIVRLKELQKNIEKQRAALKTKT